ncbi:MAG: hypothetical protein ACYC35_15170 [Pirellulales bacterium]
MKKLSIWFLFLGAIALVPVVVANMRGDVMRGAPLKSKLKAEVRPTYGKGGPTRPAWFLAGEKANFALRISDLAQNDNGEVDFTLTLELFDPEKVRLVNDCCRFNTRYAFGCGTVPVHLFITIPPDRTSPKYMFRITIDDRLGKQQAVEELAIEVSPPGTLGARDLRFAHDAAGTSDASAVAAEGDVLYFFSSVVGLTVKEQRVRMILRYAMLDENRRPITAIEDTWTLDQAVPPAGGSVNAHAQFVLTRPGHFFLRMIAEDCYAGKQLTYEIPFSVYAVP